MINGINIQTLRKVNVIVDNSFVGSIDVTQKSQSVSSTTQPTQSSLSPAMSFLMKFDDKLEQNFDLEHQTVEGNHNEDEFQDGLDQWTAKDDETLRAAVNTLGLHCWERISKYWFHGTKFDFECQHRWETVFETGNRHMIEKNDKTCTLPTSSSLSSSSLSSSLSSRNQSSNGSAFIHNCYDGGKKKFKKPTMKPTKALLKSTPLRKRRELEAIEERRLFGKDRPDAEKDLIHRAYIVGQNKVEQIMRMNAAETKEEFEATISFSSVVTEMKKVKPTDVKDSLKTNSKTVRKLPRSVMEIEEEKLLSPISDTTEDNANQKDPKKAASTREDLLNLKSSQLPIEQIIETERRRIVEVDCKKREREVPVYDSHSDGSDDDDVSFTEFLSPPLKRPFPCLGIPKPAPSRYASKPYFLF